jgi:hypothetical protein
MRSATKSGIVALLVDLVLVMNQHPVWAPVNQKPSLTQMDGNACTAISNFFPFMGDIVKA